MSHDITPQNILSSLNQVRRNPQTFISFLEKALSKFINEFQYQISPGFFMKTNEGKKAWIEALEFLKKQKPLHSYSSHKGLQLAADGHAQDLARNNIFGHTGSNGSSMKGRIQEFCTVSGAIGENCAQELKDKKGDHNVNTILSLIIDDGVKSRGHRDSIFSDRYKYVGIGIAQTKKHFIVVLDYSESNLQIHNANKTHQKSNDAKIEEKSHNAKVEENPTIHRQKQTKNGFDDFEQMQKQFKQMGFNELKWKQNGWNEGGWKQGGMKKEVYHGFKENGSGGKTVVGQSSSTKSSTVNGRTKITKTVNLTYSDGSTETKVTVEEK